MLELQTPGVQERSVERERLAAAAVAIVTDDRMVDRGQVDADLMRPPRFEPAFQEGGDVGAAVREAVASFGSDGATIEVAETSGARARADADRAARAAAAR